MCACLDVFVCVGLCVCARLCASVRDCVCLCAIVFVESYRFLSLKITSYQRSDHLILFIAHGTAKNKFLSFPIFKQSHPITVHIMLKSFLFPITSYHFLSLWVESYIFQPNSELCQPMSSCTAIKNMSIS